MRCCDFRAIEVTDNSLTEHNAVQAIGEHGQFKKSFLLPLYNAAPVWNIQTCDNRYRLLLTG